MKVSCVEGLANHNGPESCGAAREGGVEALTGGRTGWVLSREIDVLLRQQQVLRDADEVEDDGRQPRVHRHGKLHQDPARSETPLHVRKHLVQEPGIPRLSARRENCRPYREVKGRTPMTDGAGSWTV